MKIFLDQIDTNTNKFNYLFTKPDSFRYKFDNAVNQKLLWN